MAETNVERIKELLNQEKWTRATLNSYTIQNFKELDILLDSTQSEEEFEEIKTTCEEHLHHTRNSIIGLYISGIMALNQQLLDDSNLVQVISIFTDNHKWKIVEYLCKRILEFGENKIALSTLADCYESENEIEQKYQIWERLIKVDFEEADIVKHLAEKKETEGEVEEAVEYYKKAIHRYISKKHFNSIKEIWHKLIDYIPEETDLFFQLEKKVERAINTERAAQLLEELYAIYKKNENWEKGIDILKRILSYDSQSGWARKEITECYRQKFSDHSHLDEYIKLSNLSQSWRNVHEAIEEFEKHISFDAGNFVYHRTWGIGRIQSIKDNSIIIDFTRKRGHKMSLQMAVNALGSLAKDHIWVLKAVWPQAKLKKKIKEESLWALKTIIKSYDNAANMKQIKAELVPSVLTPGEWTSWSSEARKILKTDPSFGNLPEKVDHYVVRDTPISFEEKTYNRFRAEKSFFGRLKVMRDFLKHNKDPESDYFSEMFDYFTGFLKSYNQVNESVIASYLIVNRIVRDFPFLSPGNTVSFKDFLLEINTREMENIFQNLDDNELKRDFLERLKRNSNEWPSYYVRLFPNYLSKYILEELESKNHKDKIRELFTTSLDQYKEKREAFIWLAKNYAEEIWENKYNLSFEKVLIGMIHLLDITFREIENKRDVIVNRRLNKQIHAFLFLEHSLEEFIMRADIESINRLFTLVNDVDQLDPNLRIELKHKISEKFPDFKFYGDDEKETVSRGLVVTRKQYDSKNGQLQHILDVLIPETSKEIGEARELGDLKENAEYKAGKEKLELLNLNASRLKEDLERATIFEKKDVDSTKVSFGTMVTLYNHTINKEETYQFFGPWESNPENNIISYLSPFGGKLWNHKEGEDVKFEINERSYHYRIEKIQTSDF